ncbi:polysaccharide biosynthesis protein [Bacteroidota bacterium]|nr:polysaccharide biosynthesis protein [Bacteroidota bacterium]
MIEKFRKLFSEKIKGRDNKELVKGGALAFVMKIGGIGFNYVFVFVLARLYGARGSGIYSIFQTVFQFFANFGKLGYDILMVREIAQYNAKNQWGSIKELYFKVIRVNIIASIVCSFILYFSADWIATKLFLKPGLSTYFQISALGILPFVLHSVHADCFRGMKKIFYYSFFQNLIAIAIAGILLCASYFIIHDRRVPVTVFVISITISSIISFWFWWKKSPINSGGFGDKIIFSDKSKIAFSFFITALLQVIRGWTDTIFLGRYGTEADVGIYKVAFRISTITSLTLTAFLLTVAPKIAELHAKGELKRLAAVVQNTTKLIFWTSAPVLILFILFPYFFMGLFGNEFLVGEVALIILSFGQFINAATGPVGNLLMMTGKQDVNRNIVIATTVITVILNAVLIPIYGIIGAAIVNVIGTILFNVIPYFLVKRYFGFYTFDAKHIFSFKKKGFLKQS